MANDKDEKKGDSTAGGKWWEFYLVRYALGTVFGVVIVNMLVQSGVAIPFSLSSINDIGKVESYPLLIAYGLAYCYLASAPILVFHASRFAMKTAGVQSSTIAIFALSAAVSMGWVGCGFILGIPKFTKSLFFLCFLGLFSVSFLLLNQVRALNRAIRDTSALWKFYKELDANRRNFLNKELIDSYRHLREHGNAFFVVLLEFILGLALYVASKVSFLPPALIELCNPKDPYCDSVLTAGLIQTIFVVMIWIVPGAMVWAVGCLLEHEFAADTSIGIASTFVASGTPGVSGAAASGVPATPATPAIPATPGTPGTPGVQGAPGIP
jgi:hypothetical protein